MREDEAHTRSTQQWGGRNNTRAIDGNKAAAAREVVNNARDGRRAGTAGNSSFETNDGVYAAIQVRHSK